MRTTRSTAVTKILPSPIFPVCAALMMASTQRSTSSVLTTTSTFTLGRKSTTYSAPRYSSVWPFWRPKPLTSVTVKPVTPQLANASRTSSSLKGLMTAVICFMGVSFDTRSGLEFVGYRITPILAKTSVGHTNTHRRLAPFVLVDLDEMRHPLHYRWIETCSDDVLNALIVFHVALQDDVQHFVGWQTVLILLIGSQLGTWRTGDDALGDRVHPRAVRVVCVAPLRQFEHRGFHQVLDHRKATCHVTVQSAVARGHLALVARGQHDGAELVGQQIGRAH